MTHLLLQGKNNSGYEGTPQTDSLRDSSVNHALIAIAQEVTELLRRDKLTRYKLMTLKQEKQNDTAR